MSGTLRKIRVIIDPGHGELTGRTLPADTGAVGGGTTEAAQNLLVGTTLKWALCNAGYDAVLTRTDGHRPGWDERTWRMGDADIFIAVHHDSLRGRSMAYYAAGSSSAARGPLVWKSRALAQALQTATPDPEFTVQPDSASNHGRLYIRDVYAPAAVLWEIDPVHASTPAERRARAAQLLAALEIARKEGVFAV